MTADPHTETLRQWMCLDPRADWEADPDGFVDAVEALDALAARLEAAERENTRLVRDLADARKAMEFLANETLFGSIVAEYAQKKLAAAQHSTSGAYATEGGKPPAEEPA